jgi:asparagine synthase (glutamine-hydrolysing)
MPSTDPSLTLGSPRFGNAQLAALAASRGPLAAWQEAVAGNASNAAADVGGDFAVGLRLPGNRTFLAVDRFAVCSLCYRQVGGQLHFAARADELAGTGSEVDPQAIFDYLYFHVVPSPRTIFKGVYRLPPGHSALFENGTITVAPYWKPHFEEPGVARFETLKDEFRQLLRSPRSSTEANRPAS